MSSEIYNYVQNSLKKKEIDYKNKFWKLEDDDQVKAVTGICFTFGVLLVVGLFSNLVHCVKILKFCL